MKRKTSSKSQTTAAKTPVIVAHRLTAVRGGTGLGIAVDVVPPPQPIMQQQHNEMLLQL
jgi:hypothetical protein